MSLVNCPECQAEVSDKAEICPHCGYPLVGWEDDDKEENKTYLEEQEEAPKDKRGQSIFGIIGFILSIIGLFLGLTGGIILFSISIVLCIIGCFEKNKKHGFAIAGNIISFILLFSMLILFITTFSHNNASTATKEKTKITEEVTNGIEMGKDKAEEVDAESKVEKEDLKDADLPMLSTGTYVIGEDIESGKYDFYAINGNGSLKIYNTYEEYKSDEHGYDAFRDFDMLASGASVGMLNEDVYTDSVCCLRLENEQCIVIDKGLELEYKLSEPPSLTNLNVGTYIIGEDIEVGKYDFTAIKGTGNLKIYNSYDEYLSDEYGYDAFSDYDMKEDSASAGMLNEDVYTQSISNIRLEKGQCLFIDKGLTLEYVKKESN